VSAAVEFDEAFYNILKASFAVKDNGFNKTQTQQI